MTSMVVGSNLLVELLSGPRPAEQLHQQAGTNNH